MRTEKLNNEGKLLNVGFQPYFQTETGKWQQSDTVVPGKLHPASLTFFVNYLDLPEHVTLGKFLKLDDNLVFQYDENVVSLDNPEKLATRFTEVCGSFTLVVLFPANL